MPRKFLFVTTAAAALLGAASLGAAQSTQPGGPGGANSMHSQTQGVGAEENHGQGGAAAQENRGGSDRHRTVNATKRFHPHLPILDRRTLNRRGSTARCNNAPDLRDCAREERAVGKRLAGPCGQRSTGAIESPPVDSILRAGAGGSPRSYERVPRLHHRRPRVPDHVGIDTRQCTQVRESCKSRAPDQLWEYYSLLYSSMNFRQEQAMAGG